MGFDDIPRRANAAFAVVPETGRSETQNLARLRGRRHRATSSSAVRTARSPLLRRVWVDDAYSNPLAHLITLSPTRPRRPGRGFVIERPASVTNAPDRAFGRPTAVNISGVYEAYSVGDSHTPIFRPNRRNQLISPYLRAVFSRTFARWDQGMPSRSGTDWGVTTYEGSSFGKICEIARGTKTA